MKNLFKKIMVIFTVIISLTMVRPVYAQSITVSDSVTETAEENTQNTTEKEITMIEGFSKKVSIQNLKILGKEITYSTSNKKIVSITDMENTSMVLNAKKPGKATITIKTINALYVIKITVKSNPIYPSRDNAILKKGEFCSITLKNYKSIQKNYPGKNVKVSIDKENIVKITNIQNGTITIQGVQSGAATLTIKAGNKKYKVNVSVKGKKNISTPKKVQISKKKATISIGKVKKIYLKNYSIIENTYSDKSVYFKIDDSNIASIEKVCKGSIYLKGKKKGKTILEITTEKKTYRCSITVK